MKLKFYFIGLGMGIIVTAIIMEIALASRTRPMSDEEVIVRAKQLGMVEASSRLSNITQNVSSEDNQNEAVSQKSVLTSSEASASADSAVSAEKEDKAGEEAAMQGIALQSSQTGISTASADISAAKATGAAEADSSKPVTVKADSSESGSSSRTGASSGSSVSAEPAVNGGSIIVTIQDGWYSEEVSSFLESAGIVDDAAAFNTYLVQSGRDRYISPGAKLVPRGATYEDVAKVISGG